MVLEVSEEEARLVGITREQKMEFGRVVLVVYFQHDRMIRVEVNRVVESKALSLINN